VAGSDGVVEAMRRAYAGQLPPRYEASFDIQFRLPLDREVERVLRPGMSVLDAGAGARPVVEKEVRPADVTYVGLDISRDELEKAGDAYDEIVVADVTQPVPELEDRFDLVISLFLLEHVRPLEAALENLRRYLRPGGLLLAQLAGGRSASGLLNRVLPRRLAVEVVHRAFAIERTKETIFPAHYDRCTKSELARMLSPWSEVEVRPQFTGAQYFNFAPLVRAAYIGLEEWTYRGRRSDSATWYLVKARA